jgi:hypothetical protein
MSYELWGRVRDMQRQQRARKRLRTCFMWLAWAPYFTQHAEACAVERWLAGMMGVAWEEYEAAYEQLDRVN